MSQPATWSYATLTYSFGGRADQQITISPEASRVQFDGGLAEAMNALGGHGWKLVGQSTYVGNPANRDFAPDRILFTFMRPRLAAV